ncbi:MAG: hypothetical protein H0W99_04255 [Acidobacteria bacterium]|nr:hypothetical protein [Acidobacteriota bacterium]
MTVKLNQSLAELANEIIARREIDAHQVKLIRLQVFSESRILERMLEDGIIDENEAEILFAINDALSGGNYDPSWRDLFVEAITSHVLKDEISPGILDEKEAQFIVSRIKRNDGIGPVELELLVSISASVKSAPPSFQSFVLDALKTAVLRDHVVDVQDAQMIRRVIFGSGSSSGKVVDEMEKTFLRQVKEATAGSGKNHPSWDILQLEMRISDEIQPKEGEEASTERYPYH